MLAIRSFLFSSVTPNKVAASDAGDKKGVAAPAVAPHSDQGPSRTSSMIHQDDDKVESLQTSSPPPPPPVPDHMSTTLPPLPKSAPAKLPGRQSLRSSSTSQLLLPQQQQHHHQNQHMIRARSLSKVFTQLPAQLPSITEIQVDVIEWYAYILLLEQDRDKHCHYKQQLETCLQNLGNLKIPQYGRLFNRLQVTALCSDITCMKIEFMMPAVCVEEDDDDDDDGNMDHDGVNQDAKESKSDLADKPTHDLPYSIAISPNDWDRMTEQLILVKSLLLRQDANTLVLPGITSIVMSHAHHGGDVQLDQTLAQHDMMTEQYQDVLQLLRVQKAIATLLQALRDMEKAAEHRVPTQKQRMKQLRLACNEYEQALKQEFDKREDHHQHHDSEEQVIPKVLTKFLLKEGGGIDTKKINVTEFIREQVYQLVLSLDGPFSHATLQHKMRALLQKWSESILEIPTLVKLGYGGVISPVMEGADGDDDVSSWGGSDDGHDETALVDHSLASVTKRIRRSGAQRISVTEEEREMMEHLNSSSDEAGPLLPLAQQQSYSDTPLLARRHHPATVPRWNQNQVATLKRDSVRFSEIPHVEPPPEGDDDVPALPVSLHEQEESPLLARRSRTKRKRIHHEQQHHEEEEEGNEDDWLVTRRRRKAGRNGSDRENRDDDESSFDLNSSDQQEQEDSSYNDNGPQMTPSPKTKKTRKKKTRERRTSGTPKTPFTLDEVRAIRAGIRKFGIGHWAEMKAADTRLQNRTSVQIKDKYRTMLKRNEI